ncbi:hypothetical protein C8R45DRAFT_946041 [Mycena sanguinolenta]|nr:hypothetical protein C8R45DRAFT_946041 [Mycena sanguinolenta]
MGFTEHAHFAEMIDGAGGTMDDLAVLLMRHMDDVVNGQFSWKIGCLEAYMRFLARLILAVDSASTQSHLPTRQKFHEILRLYRFIPAFVVAMNTVLGVSKSKPESWRRDNFESSSVVTLELLEYLLTTMRGYRSLRPAIEAGLLSMMTGIAAEFPSMFDDRLRFLLTKILPDGLLYHHAVAAIEKVLDDAAEMWSSEELEEAEILDDSFIP